MTPMHSPLGAQAHARCGAKTRSGEPCKLPPLKGQTRCRMHGAKTPVVIAKARARILEAKIRGQLEQRGFTAIEDPFAAYADMAGEVWAFKELCREQINQLESWARRNEIGTEEASALITVYERALDRTQKALADMIRLGLSAESLRLAKERPSREQAEVFSRVLDHLRDGLNLTPEQHAAFPSILASALAKEALT